MYKLQTLFGQTDSTMLRLVPDGIAYFYARVPIVFEDSQARRQKENVEIDFQERFFPREPKPIKKFKHEDEDPFQSKPIEPKSEDLIYSIIDRFPQLNDKRAEFLSESEERKRRENNIAFLLHDFLGKPETPQIPKTRHEENLILKNKQYDIPLERLIEHMPRYYEPLLEMPKPEPFYIEQRMVLVQRNGTYYLEHGTIPGRKESSEGSTVQLKDFMAINDIARHAKSLEEMTGYVVEIRSTILPEYNPKFGLPLYDMIMGAKLVAMDGDRTGFGMNLKLGF